MKAVSFLLVEPTNQQSPTARLLQIICEIHQSKLKDDGIQVVGLQLVPKRGYRIACQSDIEPAKAKQQIGQALADLNFWPEEGAVIEL